MEGILALDAGNNHTNYKNFTMWDAKCYLTMLLDTDRRIAVFDIADLAMSLPSKINLIVLECGSNTPAHHSVVRL